MIYKTAICDDDVQARALLSRMVEKWAFERGHNVSVSEYPSAEAFLFDYEEDGTFDILLLDVEMKGTDGITLAKDLRRGGCRAQIVFVTSHFEFCAMGYEVDALHYLTKPVGEDALFTVFDKASEKLTYEPPSVIVSSDGGTVRIFEHEILYAESLLHYTLIHTVDRDYKIKEGLSAFAERLSDTFYRSHRGYLVSLERIVRISRSSLTLSDGTELPLARGKYDGINRAFIEHN